MDHPIRHKPIDTGTVIRPVNMSDFFHVCQELDLIDEENVVYKLIGPVLIRQDLEEARQNVAKRVDYIQQEMWVFFYQYDWT